MRIQEIFNDEEWQRLEQLIYASAYKALITYQQQRTTQQRIASKLPAALKPQTAKKANTLARKAKRIPRAAAPNPLPQAKAVVTQAYRPVKTATPLPPTTRLAVAKAKPAAPKPIPNKPAPASITDPNYIDQATRRWLPPDKKGPNPIDLFSI